VADVLTSSAGAALIIVPENLAIPTSRVRFWLSFFMSSTLF
jgi:hypothetical protein